MLCGALLETGNVANMRARAAPRFACSPTRLRNFTAPCLHLQEAQLAALLGSLRLGIGDMRQQAQRLGREEWSEAEVGAGWQAGARRGSPTGAAFAPDCLPAGRPSPGLHGALTPCPSLCPCPAPSPLPTGRQVPRRPGAPALRPAVALLLGRRRRGGAGQRTGRGAGRRGGRQCRGRLHGRCHLQEGGGAGGKGAGVPCQGREQPGERSQGGRHRGGGGWGGEGGTAHRLSRAGESMLYCGSPGF